MLNTLIITLIFLLILIVYLNFLNTIKIKSKVEELNIKLDYIENKLDK
mgnify:FL=1